MDRAEERLRATEKARRASDTEHDAQDEREVEAAGRLSATQIYEVIRRDGVEEMARPHTSLMFSGLAAGILISFSVLGEAVLAAHLPETDWRPLVESFGYTLGFLLVIMGRMQLFTENTITTVLPLTAAPCREYFYLTGRLWAIVLAANVVGAFAAAIFIAHSGAFSTEVLEATREISEKAVLNPALVGFVKAVPAGVIVAAIVWMLPSVSNNPFFVIFTFTWLIAAGGFTHIIAGSVEMAFLTVEGALSLFEALRFFIPVLLGNVVGGTIVFTIIAWAQVAAEVEK